MRKSTLMLTFLAVSCTSARPSGTTPVSQPAAMTTYHAGLNDVRFTNEGDTLAGHLFLPATYQPVDKLPTIVVTGAWTTVKEQMPDQYARKLADAGFAAVTFDFRGYGTSTGQPRQWESASRKVSDLKAAAEFAHRLPMAGDRVGALAICFGAGYMARAIADGARYDSFATIAAWLHDRDTLVAVFGQSEIERRYQVGRAALAAYQDTGHVDYVPAASTTDTMAAMYQVDYYSTNERGLIPQYDNRFAVMSWPEWLDLDGLALAPAVRVPTLVVHSDGSALPQNAKRFYETLGTTQKQLVWLSGNHTDFYDREPQVAEAARAVASHFHHTL